MESWRTFRSEIDELERRQLFSVSSFKRWTLSIILVLVAFNYMWKWAFPRVNYDHYPPALRPTESQILQHELALRTGVGRQMQLKEINFVIFACSSDGQNDPAYDAIITMKSAALLATKIIHFHIFTDDRLYHIFMEELDKWPNHIRHRVAFQFHHATYPESMFGLQKTFDTTSCQLSFLFLPNILKDLDHVIYVKSGSIFLKSPDNLWSILLDYTKTNAVSLLPLNQYGMSYKTDADKNQIQQVFNSNIMIFDMSRVRQTVFKIPMSKKQHDFPITSDNYHVTNTTWHPHMLLTICKLFEPWFQDPAKDILNIIAFFNPKVINQMPCLWGCNTTTPYMISPPQNRQEKSYSKLRCLMNAVNFNNFSRRQLDFELMLLEWHN